MSTIGRFLYAMRRQRFIAGVVGCGLARKLGSPKFGARSVDKAFELRTRG